IGQLAAEVEPAHEAERLAERDALPLSEPSGQRERRRVAQEELGPLSSRVSGRQQKDPMHGAMLARWRRASGGARHEERLLAARGTGGTIAPSPVLPMQSCPT